MPRMSPVLQMMEPTAFPSAISERPWSAATTETTASGVVVPRLTMVAPITTRGTPQRCERATALSTSHSAPLASPATLAARATTRTGVERPATRLSRYSAMHRKV